MPSCIRFRGHIFLVSPWGQIFILDNLVFLVYLACLVYFVKNVWIVRFVEIVMTVEFVKIVETSMRRSENALIVWIVIYPSDGMESITTTGNYSRTAGLEVSLRLECHSSF
jgi:hypothetical protein